MKMEGCNYLLWHLSIIAFLFIGHYKADDRKYPEEVHRLFLERLQRTQNNMVGSWGDWSSWSSCSKSCGTGVSTQSRECLLTPNRKRSRRAIENTKSSRCVGRYKRFQLCNAQDCPGGYTDFRREQCSSFNRTPFNHRVYSWEPYYDTPASCALNCRAVGLSFYATLNQSVVDGTNCGPDRDHRICVSGKCMIIGCDGVIGSGRALDACGVCGGTNSTCRVFAGIYGRPRMPYGYNVIATLPLGAANITIKQTKPSQNYLALKETGGDFFLNGNWAVNQTGAYEAAGTIFYYRSPQRYVGDSLTSPGPLLNSVDVMLFYQSTNAGIKYEYKLPVSSSRRPPPSPPLTAPGHRQADNPLNPLVPGGPASRIGGQNSYSRLPPAGPVNDERSRYNGISNSIYPTKERKWEEELWKKRKEKKKDKKKHDKNKRRKSRYEWKMTGFTPCSETCGGGTQISMVSCIKRKKGNQVPNKYCGDLPKPPVETVKCNLKSCPARWEPEPWGECSVTCGIGIRTRNLICKQKLSHDRTITVVDQSECGDIEGIDTAQVCKQPSCDAGPQWMSGEWGECSAQCGSGVRKRDVSCRTSSGIVPDRLCQADNRPIHQELCDMGSCASDTWFFSSWEENCSESCGSGIQRRKVHCSGGLGSNFQEQNGSKPSCPVEEKPSNTRPCTSDRECGGTWFTGPWGECDSWCGQGRQSRLVMCIVWIRGQYRVTSDISNCKSAPKPASSQLCNKSCQAQWFTSEWSQCSTSCNGGVQRREVKCLDEEQKPSLHCPGSTKPDTRQSCNNVPCSPQDSTKESNKLDKGTLGEQSDRLNDAPSPPSDKTKDSYSSTGNLTSSPYKYLERPGTEYQSAASATPVPESLKLEHTRGNVDKNQFVKKTDASAETNSVTSKDGGKKRHKPPKHGGCVDRMKNCHLVFKARLCRLKYYYKLCCQTCSAV